MTDSKKQKASRVDAVGGASSGTLLLFIAHQVGANTTAGEWLTYASPWFAIVAGYLVRILRIRGNQFAIRQATKAEQAELEQARTALELLLKSPYTSEEHKAYVRSQLEERDRMVIERTFSRLNRMWTADDAPTDSVSP
jgi:hypothetical protein